MINLIKLEDKMVKRIKAQSTLEYAMVVFCVVLALVGMNIYVKRSIQGRIRSAADDMGEQYSPKTTKSHTVQNFISSSTVAGDPLIIETPDPDMSSGPLTSAETTEMYNYVQGHSGLKVGDTFALSTGRQVSIDQKEFVTTKRTEHQDLIQEAGTDKNYEETGKFSDE